MKMRVSPWIVKLGVAAVAGLVIMRGGGGMLRFILPAVGIYVGYKFIRKFLLPETPAASRVAESSADGEPVIEICPECGHEKLKNHKCG